RLATRAHGILRRPTECCFPSGSVFERREKPIERLRRRSAGRVDLPARGSDREAEQLRRQTKSSGDGGGGTRLKSHKTPEALHILLSSMAESYFVAFDQFAIHLGAPGNTPVLWADLRVEEQTQREVGCGRAAGGSGGGGGGMLRAPAAAAASAAGSWAGKAGAERHARARSVWSGGGGWVDQRIGDDQIKKKPTGSWFCVAARELVALWRRGGGRRRRRRRRRGAQLPSFLPLRSPALVVRPRKSGARAARRPVRECGRDWRGRGRADAVLVVGVGGVRGGEWRGERGLRAASGGGGSERALRDDVRALQVQVATLLQRRSEDFKLLEDSLRGSLEKSLELSSLRSQVDALRQEVEELRGTTRARNDHVTLQWLSAAVGELRAEAAEAAAARNASRDLQRAQQTDAQLRLLRSDVAALRGEAQQLRAQAQRDAVALQALRGDLDSTQQRAQAAAEQCADNKEQTGEVLRGARPLEDGFRRIDARGGGGAGGARQGESQKALPTSKSPAHLDASREAPLSTNTANLLMYYNAESSR
ncbi:Protein scabrous, partial [Gryllus bimaculatus]